MYLFSAPLYIPKASKYISLPGEVVFASYSVPPHLVFICVSSKAITRIEESTASFISGNHTKQFNKDFPFNNFSFHFFSCDAFLFATFCWDCVTEFPLDSNSHISGSTGLFWLKLGQEKARPSGMILCYFEWTFEMGHTFHFHEFFWRIRSLDCNLVPTLLLQFSYKVFGGYNRFKVWLHGLNIFHHLLWIIT